MQEPHTPLELTANLVLCWEQDLEVVGPGRPCGILTPLTTCAGSRLDFSGPAPCSLANVDFDALVAGRPAVHHGIALPGGYVHH
jgi:hypothetical protein